MLNLAFFNTGEGRVTGYLNWAQTHLPSFSIFCLSEVHDKHAPNPQTRRNTSPKPGVQSREMFDQYDRLVDIMRDSHHCRHDASAVHEGDGALYGLATFTSRSSPRAYGFQAEAVHGYYGAPWPSPRLYSSCSQIVSFFVELDDCVLLCAHGHFAWIKEGKDDHIIRDRQSHRIVAHLERRADEMLQHAKPVEVMLGGDFNVRPDLRALHSIQAANVFGPDGAAILNDTVEHGYDTRTNHYAKDERAADYVLVSEALRERVVLTINRNVPSDHALLLVALQT